MLTIGQASGQKQVEVPDPLSVRDRRLLLSASLQLFLHRLRHGMSVMSADLARLAQLGDNPEDHAA